MLTLRDASITVYSDVEHGVNRRVVIDPAKGICFPLPAHALISPLLYAGDTQLITSASASVQLTLRNPVGNFIQSPRRFSVARRLYRISGSNSSLCFLADRHKSDEQYQTSFNARYRDPSEECPWMNCGMPANVGNLRHVFFLIPCWQVQRQQ